LAQALGQAGVALAEEAEIERERLAGLEHAADVPSAGRASRGVRAGGRAGAAAHERRDAAHERVPADLRADEVHVDVEGARGKDLALAGDGLGPGPDHDVDARLHVRIARLANAGDAAVAVPTSAFTTPQ